MTMNYVPELDQSYGYAAYGRGDGPRDNPYSDDQSAQYADWDRGYWQAHNDAADAHPIPTSDEDGIEEGYGNFEDVSVYRWDDDPSPYDGTYSEM